MEQPTQCSLKEQLEALSKLAIAAGLNDANKFILGALSAYSYTEPRTSSCFKPQKNKGAHYYEMIINNHSYWGYCSPSGIFNLYRLRGLKSLPTGGSVLIKACSNMFEAELLVKRLEKAEELWEKEHTINFSNKQSEEIFEAFIGHHHFLINNYAENIFNLSRNSPYGTIPICNCDSKYEAEALAKEIVDREGMW